jgi:hypothetical protein
MFCHEKIYMLIPLILMSVIALLNIPPIIFAILKVSFTAYAKEIEQDYRK